MWNCLLSLVLFFFVFNEKKIIALPQKIFLELMKYCWRKPCSWTFWKKNLNSFNPLVFCTGLPYRHLKQGEGVENKIAFNASNSSKEACSTFVTCLLLIFQIKLFKNTIIFLICIDLEVLDLFFGTVLFTEINKWL